MTPQSGPTPPEEPGAAPNMFTRERIGEGGAARVATLVALLDAQEQQPAVRRLRAWAFEALAPEPGESVVDVGAGLGTELRRLAEPSHRTDVRSVSSPTPACARRRRDVRPCSGPPLRSSTATPPTCPSPTAPCTCCAASASS
ncbi:MAG: hypothetical protein JF622_00005, partial [Terrabacter sp.]|nr:hypothetical protein [Terrabacter sp.]